MSKFIKEDKLVYLPIEGDTIIFDCKDCYNFDRLIVVDNLGKLWGDLYAIDHIKAPIYDRQFLEWFNWISTGVEPIGVSEAVKKHYQIYEYSTSLGLASKCMHYLEYGKALLEVIEKSFEQEYKNGEISQRQKRILIQSARKIFKQAQEGFPYVGGEGKDKFFVLVEFINKVKPFKFVGLYYADGELDYEREDYVLGQSLSTIPIPKIAYELNDEKLAEINYTISDMEQWLDMLYDECPHGLFLEERNCRECSLSNYGLDCHNNPINDVQE